MPNALLATVALLSGCAGMPPKRQPAALPTRAPLSDVEFAGGEWPAPDWWKRYHDGTLDRLVDMALATSPTLATAHARFDSAKQSVRIAGAASGVHVEASADADRQRLSDNGVFPPRLLGFYDYSLYDLGLQANYTFDWWGKQKSSVEAAVDEAHAAQAERSAAALLLASSVADAYFGWQADNDRLALARQRERTVLLENRISVSRIRAELDSDDAAQRSAGDVADVRGQIADLQGSARLRIVALAALVGCAAAELPSLTARPLPVVEGALPDDVGIDLLARRADIAASRWRIEAAQKNRDSARAEFYPDVSINALIGVQSIDIGSLLRYGSRVPQVAGAIHLPIFDEGRLQARYGASEAAIDAAVANYRETLVSAARDVATAAATRAQLVAQRTQRVLQVEAARRLRTSAAARVTQGIVDPRDELTAARAFLEQQDALLLLDAAALSTDIGLQRALGGGYDRTGKSP